MADVIELEKAKRRPFVSEDGFDLCVMTGEKTPYRTETPVDLRLYYVEGAGQLCQKAYEAIYGK
jgi:hypothetical protein